MASKSDAIDTNYTVFIRVPFPRGEFEDPPPVSALSVEAFFDINLQEQVEWSAPKDQALWDILSRPSKGDIDCMITLCVVHLTF
jgi:hypothetical protein